MLQEILDAIKCREETVDFLGRKVLVREINSAAPLGGTPEEERALEASGIAAGDLVYWRVFVRAVLDAETQAPIFSLVNIPALEAGSRSKLLSLVRAVNRTNGLDAEDNAKN